MNFSLLLLMVRKACQRVAEARSEGSASKKSEFANMRLEAAIKVFNALFILKFFGFR